MRRYHPVVTAAAVRVCRRWGSGTREEIEDVVQEIYLRICANQGRILMSFRDSRPEAVFGFLKVTSTNIAHDVFRRQSAVKRGGAHTRSIEEVADLPGAAADLDRGLTLAEVESALVAQTQSENGPRDRQVFLLYYRHGMTAEAIAQLPGIDLTTKGVESLLHRLTKLIRGAMQKGADAH